MTSKSTSPSSIDTQRVPKRRRKTQTDDGPLRQPAANSSPGADGASAGPGTGSGSSGSGGASSSFRNVSACNRCRLRKNRCDQRLPACVSCEKAGVRCVGYDPLTKRKIPRSYVNYLEMRVAYLEALCATSNINFSPADDFLDISPIPILSPIPISSARSAQPTATAVNAHFVPDHLGSYLYPAQVAASSYSPSPPYLPLNVSSKSTSPSSIDTQGTPKRRRKTYQQNTYHQGHGDMMLHPAPQPRVYLPPAQAAPGDWRRTHMTQFGIPEFEVEMWEHDSWNDDGNSGQVGLLDGFYFGNRS